MFSFGVSVPFVHLSATYSVADTRQSQCWPGVEIFPLLEYIRVDPRERHSGFLSQPLNIRNLIFSESRPSVYRQPSYWDVLLSTKFYTTLSTFFPSTLFLPVEHPESKKLLFCIIPFSVLSILYLLRLLFFRASIQTWNNCFSKGIVFHICCFLHFKHLLSIPWTFLLCLFCTSLVIGIWWGHTGGRVLQRK